MYLLQLVCFNVQLPKKCGEIPYKSLQLNFLWKSVARIMLGRRVSDPYVLAGESNGTDVRIQEKLVYPLGGRYADA